MSGPGQPARRGAVAVHEDPGRLALAVHEAGHAVAAVLLGRRCTGVTIELDNGRRGRNYHERLRRLNIPDDAVLGCSVLLMNWRLRRELEHRLAVILAGPIAAATYAAFVLPAGFHPPDPDEERAHRIVEQRKKLPPDIRALFEEADTLRDLSDEFQSDEFQAFRLSQLGSSGSPDVSTSFLIWAQAEVAAWVRRESFRRPLAAVTRELHEHGELSGDRVHELVAAAQTSDIDAALAAETASVC